MGTENVEAKQKCIRLAVCKYMVDVGQQPVELADGESWDSFMKRANARLETIDGVVTHLDRIADEKTLEECSAGIFNHSLESLNSLSSLTMGSDINACPITLFSAVRVCGYNFHRLLESPCAGLLIAEYFDWTTIG